MRIFARILLRAFASVLAADVTVVLCIEILDRQHSISDVLLEFLVGFFLLPFGPALGPLPGATFNWGPFLWFVGLAIAYTLAGITCTIRTRRSAL